MNAKQIEQVKKGHVIAPAQFIDFVNSETIQYQLMTDAIESLVHELIHPDLTTKERKKLESKAVRISEELDRQDIRRVTTIRI